MTRAGLSKPVRFVALLVLYLVARVGVVQRLDAPTFGWRPADLASIAINYYRNGFHFAYPQVMWGGAGAGHVEMEFPLQSYLTAIFFKLFGLHDWLCLVLPFAFGFGIVWVVAEFGRYLFGEIAGFAGALNVALSPTLVYITSFGMWADPPMVFFGTLGLYLLTRWSRDGNSRLLWTGVVSIAFAILFKLTALYLGVVVLWLFIERYGRGFLRQPTTWLAAAAMLTPALLWYAHAYNLYLEDGNTFGIIGGGYLKFPTRSLLTDSYVYKHALIRVVFYHLTLLGFLAFAYGSYEALRGKRWLVLIWLAAIVLHTFVVWAGVQYSGNIGYLLPILPICNLIGGLGFQSFVEALRQRAGSRWRPQLYLPLLGALGLLVTVNTVVSSRRLNDRDLAFETALWQNKKLTGLQVARVTRPGSLIIVADHEMDSVDQKRCMTPPEVFFFGDRRGWYLSFAWLTPEKIEQLRAEGAEYFVVSLQSVNQFQRDHVAIHEYLKQHFRQLTDQDGIIYALAGK